MALVPAAAHAGGRVSAGGPVLSFAPGARSTAMGLSGVADPSDPTSTWFNPAAIAVRPSVFGNISYRGLVPDLANDVWFGSAAVGGSFVRSGGPFAFAAGLEYARLDYGESMATDPTGRPLGVHNSYETSIGLTAGAAWTSRRVRVAAGFSIKDITLAYAPEEFVVDPMPTTGNATAFDIGLIASTTIEATDWRIEPGIGVAWINAGGEIEFSGGADGTDPLPERLNYGLSVRITGPDVALGSTRAPMVTVVQNVDVMANQLSEYHRLGFGIEAGVLEILWIRFGSIVDKATDTSVTTWGAGLGIPVSNMRIRFDYTSEPQYYFSSGGYRRNIYALYAGWLL